MYWSSGDERWKVDIYEIYADSVAKRQALGWIFSTSNVDCPMDAVWSQYQDIKPDPNLSVKMRCRTNYGNQEDLYEFSVCSCSRTECHVEPRNP